MRRFLSALTVAAALSVAACSGADWHHSRHDSSYQPPGELRITITAHAHGQGLRQAVIRLRDALVAELAERGIRVNQASTTGSVLQLDVTEWDPGSRGARQFAGYFGAGHAQIDVDVAITRAGDEQPAIAGHAVGYIRSGGFGGSALDAPEEAATLIADVISGKSP